MLKGLQVTRVQLVALEPLAIKETLEIQEAKVLKVTKDRLGQRAYKEIREIVELLGKKVTMVKQAQKVLRVVKEVLDHQARKEIEETLE